MEITEVNAAVEGERRLIANLIMSTPLLSACTEMGTPELFTKGVCRTIAEWLWEFHKVQHKAPERAIEDIYLHKAVGLRVEDSAALRLFLGNMSEDWAPTNIDLIKSQALDFFRAAAIRNLRDDLDRALLTRDTNRAEALIAKYIAPAPIHSTTVQMFSSSSANIIAEAFNEEAETLVTFPGDAGKVLGSFAREDFVAFSAPPKRGKSWWLIKMAAVAASQGNRVLFISLEMKEAQVIRRFWQLLTGTSRYGGDVTYSTFTEAAPGTYSLTSCSRETIKADSELASIEDAQKRMATYYRGDLRIRTYPANSLSIGRLKEDLDSLQLYEHFTPDVIVIDYADIIRHTTAAKETRDRINDTWVSLRGIASERKVLMVTASQTGRATVGGQKDASEEDIAEDIRKVAHVTKMIMINQNPTERQQGLYRLACNTTRDEAVAPSQLLCTACLAIGDPMVDSRMLSNVNYNATDDEDEPRRQPRRGSFL